MATHVGGTTTNGSSASSYTISYSSADGNALVLGILLTDGSKSVLGVTDDVGADPDTKVPFNTWQRLGALTNIAGERVELWGAVKTQAVTTITIVLSGVQGIETILEEYSGATAFGPTSQFNATTVITLNLTTVFTQNSDFMVSFFAAGTNDGITGTTGTLRHQLAVFARFASVDNSTPECGITLSTVVREAIQAISVTLVASLSLVVQPGFSDVPDAAFAANQGAHGILLNRVAQNAALGMCRSEFFIQTHIHGDTVDLPVSPIDGYAYQRDELMYIYTPVNTFDPSSGWITSYDCAFYSKWDVDEFDGKVTCVVVYGESGSHPKRGSTNDSTLTILVVAQRRAKDLVAAQVLDYAGIDLTQFAVDKPLTQRMAQALNRSAKFATVATEVMYLGEYVDGQQLPRPISPVDGRIYEWAECRFMSSWLWTTQPDLFTQPPSGWDQAQEILCSISATGVVSANSLFFNNNPIDPTDPANGGLAYGRIRVFAFCQRNHGPYFGFPPASLYASGSAITGDTYFTKLSSFFGSTTGKFKVQITGATAGGFTSLDITKCKILTTAKGSTTVTASVNVLFSGVASVSIPSGTVTESDGTSITLDDDHDYYLVILVGTNCGMRYADTGGAHGGGPDIVGWLFPYSFNYNSAVVGDQTGVGTIPTLSTSGSMNIITGMSFVADIDATTQNSFAEIGIEELLPGKPLPYTVLKQLARNILEACNNREVFGPTQYDHGDVIPTPVSPLDSYAYSRAELVYFWTWRDTGPNTNPRLVGFGSTISASGVVTLNTWNLSVGGPFRANHDGTIDVIVVGVRANLNGHSSSSTTDNTNPPTDAGTITTDSNGGFNVNGV